MALQQGFSNGGLGKWIYTSLFSLLPQKFDFSLQESSLSKVGNYVYFEKVPWWFESPTTPLSSSQTFPRLRIMAVSYFPFRKIICMNISTENISRSMWTRVIF